MNKPETIELTIRVIDQTERRMVDGESVPAAEKTVSIFEPPTDVIRKDGGETLYEHKLCLSAGASNLITDCVILNGNRADSTLTVEIMKRHTELFNQVPEQVALDGAFGSINNLADPQGARHPGCGFHQSALGQDYRHGQGQLGLQEDA